MNEMGNIERIIKSIGFAQHAIHLELLDDVKVTDYIIQEMNYEILPAIREEQDKGEVDVELLASLGSQVLRIIVVITGFAAGEPDVDQAAKKASELYKELSDEEVIRRSITV